MQTVIPVCKSNLTPSRFIIQRCLIQLSYRLQCFTVEYLVDMFAFDVCGIDTELFEALSMRTLIAEIGIKHEDSALLEILSKRSIEVFTPRECAFSLSSLSDISPNKEMLVGYDVCCG